MADFSEIPWIAEHIALYKSDPEKAHDWDSSHLGGPGVLPTPEGRAARDPLQRPSPPRAHPPKIPRGVHATGPGTSFHAGVRAGRSSTRPGPWR